MIFNNIERKTVTSVPEIVKKVSSWVIKFNINRTNKKLLILGMGEVYE